MSPAIRKPQRDRRGAETAPLQCSQFCLRAGFKNLTCLKYL